jgi:hypothetical protein
VRASKRGAPEGETSEGHEGGEDSEVDPGEGSDACAFVAVGCHAGGNCAGAGLEDDYHATYSHPGGPSHAFSGSSGSESANADSQALESLTYQFTGAELQAQFYQVKDLLKADGQQPGPMLTRKLHTAFPYESAG